MMKIYKKLLKRMFGHEIETYGLIDIIRLYSGFQSYLPLQANIYHGWYNENPRKSDLQNPRNLLLVFNRRQAKEWRAESDTPVAIAGAPFIHYRRLKNIHQRDDAQGTIVYPGHDATSIDAKFDQHKFCETLAALDPKFHPITISVMEKDIENGRDKIYQDYGFNTFCPGPRLTMGFCQNFYDELSKHKYSCGNHIGTNILYSIEMGIPFFLIGQKMQGINRNTGEFHNIHRSTNHHDLIEKIELLFKTPVDTVSQEQTELIMEESGVNDCLSPDELKKLLMHTLLTKDIPDVLKRMLFWPLKPFSKKFKQ